MFEVDILPHAAVCEDMVFAFCRSGEVRSVVRQGSSNTSKKEMDKKKEGSFDAEVKKRAEMRRAMDLREKKSCLLKEAEELREKSPVGDIETREIMRLIHQTTDKVRIMAASLILIHVIHDWQIDEYLDGKPFTNAAIRELFAFLTPAKELSKLAKTFLKEPGPLDMGEPEPEMPDEDGEVDPEVFDRAVLYRARRRLKLELREKVYDMRAELEALGCNTFRYRHLVNPQYLKESEEALVKMDEVLGNVEVPKSAFKLLGFKPAASKWAFPIEDEENIMQLAMEGTKAEERQVNLEKV